MTVREGELQHIRDLLLKMAGLVEDSIKNAVKALVQRDSELARQVMTQDQDVNSLDVRIEEECVELLALKQPMGSDLRIITTAIKITTDLERIADNAVNLAERALELNDEPQLKPFIDIPEMGRISSGMVRDAIDAFIHKDKRLALDVIMRDDEVDDLNEAVFEELVTIMRRDHESVDRAIKITYISKYLERIADHATNIAEMVIFMVEGRIIRHMELTRRGSTG